MKLFHQNIQKIALSHMFIQVMMLYKNIEIHKEEIY